MRLAFLYFSSTEVQTLYKNQVICTEQEYHVKNDQDPTRSWQIHKDGVHKYCVTKHNKNRLSALQNHSGRQLYNGEHWKSELGQMRPSIPGCAREWFGNGSQESQLTYVCWLLSSQLTMTRKKLTDQSAQNHAGCNTTLQRMLQRMVFSSRSKRPLLSSPGWRRFIAASPSASAARLALLPSQPPLRPVKAYFHNQS